MYQMNNQRERQQREMHRHLWSEGNQNHKLTTAFICLILSIYRYHDRCQARAIRNERSSMYRRVLPHDNSSASIRSERSFSVSVLFRFPFDDEPHRRDRSEHRTLFSVKGTKWSTRSIDTDVDIQNMLSPAWFVRGVIFPSVGIHAGEYETRSTQYENPSHRNLRSILEDLFTTSTSNCDGEHHSPSQDPKYQAPNGRAALPNHTISIHPTDLHLAPYGSIMWTVLLRKNDIYEILQSPTNQLSREAPLLSQRTSSAAPQHTEARKSSVAMNSSRTIECDAHWSRFPGTHT